MSGIVARAPLEIGLRFAFLLLTWNESDCPINYRKLNQLIGDIEEGDVTSLMDGIVAGESGGDSRFPNAPHSWTPNATVETARKEGLEISEDHWEVVRALQEFFARHGKVAVNLRELHDALDEKFHGRGGMKYLYTLLPGGPIAQGCRLAGLEVPAGAVDKGFGSVA